MAKQDKSRSKQNLAIQKKPPEYVIEFWEAMKKFGASTELKTYWTKILIRRLEATAAAGKKADAIRHLPLNEATKKLGLEFARHADEVERIGLMGMCLMPSELKWVGHVITGILTGSLTIDLLYKAIRVCQKSIPA